MLVRISENYSRPVIAKVEILALLTYKHGNMSVREDCFYGDMDKFYKDNMN